MTTMTESAPFRLSSRTVYSLLWVLAGVTYGGLIVLDQPFAAVGAFVAFGLGAVVYRMRVGRPLFDERDNRIRQQAADSTMWFLGIASAVFFPTAVVLGGLGYHSWPPWLAYLGFYALGLWGLYGFVNLLVRRNR